LAWVVFSNSTFSWLGKSHRKKNETNRDESKARNEKKKKKTQSATLKYFILFDNMHFGSRICNKFRICTVGRDVDGDGSSNSKKQIQKQLKKPDLYEEEKIEGKSKQK
jgi:hypothetical protein